MSLLVDTSVWSLALSTIDALLIKLCRRHGLKLLTTDKDFRAAAKHVEFPLWARSRRPG
ncbi:PIN domain-containing protein [bacterium]|nr:PIN domain-containing protein [bacterium]